MAVRNTAGGACQIVVSPCGPLIVAIAALMDLPPADAIDGFPDLEQPTTITLRSGGATVAVLAVTYGADGAPTAVASMPLP